MWPNGSGWLGWFPGLSPDPERLGKWPGRSQPRKFWLSRGLGEPTGEPARCPGSPHPCTQSAGPSSPSGGLGGVTRSYLGKVAPASLSLDFAPCKLEGAGKVRGESGETWLGLNLRRLRRGHSALPLATSGQEKGFPWVSPGAWSSVNLVFSLKRVRECFPLTSLQAAISGLAIAPHLSILWERKQAPS